jgi:hypothetical protein
MAASLCIRLSLYPSACPKYPTSVLLGRQVYNYRNAGHFQRKASVTELLTSSCVPICSDCRLMPLLLVNDTLDLTLTE